MPYKSAAQRRFMYSQHPDIAAKWDRQGKNYITGQGTDRKPKSERKASRSSSSRSSSSRSSGKRK